MKKVRFAEMEWQVNKLVVKLGTKQITDTKSINFENIKSIVSEIVELKKEIEHIVLVTSGAIGLGVYEFYGGKIQKYNYSLSQKQALAGVGQVKLMQVLKEEFAKYGIFVGQVLLTQSIFDNRKTYLNAKNTLSAMLEMGIIPVINENDSVATEEIKVGQNDTLGALVSLLLDADLYIMLSDVDGLYKNYHSENREFIKVVDDIKKVIDFAREGEECFTRGGMITKIEASKITTRSGIPTVIANGFMKDRIKLVLNNFSIGTLFLPARKPLNHKKRWILGKRPKGIIYVDEGASVAIRNNKSLLASGIINFEGEFDYGDTVKVYDPLNNEIARGLINYNSKQLGLIMGKKNWEIEQILAGENSYSCVIHIDNMVLF